MAPETTANSKPSRGQIGVTRAQYIKDFSFESPNAPQIFAPAQTPPELTHRRQCCARGRWS